MATYTLRRDRIRLRELLRAGRLAGVPVTVAMADGNPRDLPLELYLGLITCWLQEERPDLTYEAVVDLMDGQEIAIVFGAAPDPKATASVLAANGSS